MAGFGFTPNDPSDESDENRESSGNPFDFQEIFKQFSGLGLNLPGLISALSGQASPGSLSKDLIRDISKKFLSAQGDTPVTLESQSASHEALKIADLWLNEATAFAGLPILESSALSRRDWIDATLSGWQELAKPLVDGMSEAMNQMLKETLGDSTEFEGLADNPLKIPGAPFDISKSTLTSIMGTFISSLLSTQLGQTIGSLSTTVTGANDVALPLMEPIRAQLLPQNVSNWGEGLEIDEGELRIYLALREVAAARLFAGAPWLRKHIKETIAAYGRGIKVDISAITEQAENAMNSVDPSDPESMTLAISGGLFTPEETPEQKRALENLETLLALIEGWIDAVVALAAKDRLPSLSKLSETQQRRRATKSPTQQLFATLVGLEVSPRKTREAMQFWEKIVELRDQKTRDEIWDESFLLPTSDQLGEPLEFLKGRTVPDDLSGL
jgi:putative hydrolase